MDTRAHGELVPNAAFPLKNAFPVVVAPPEIVRPPFCSPLPIVDDAREKKPALKPISVDVAFAGVVPKVVGVHEKLAPRGACWVSQ